ncbi:MAG: hypothetical protein H8E12_05540 [Rhodobacteraceae bacterium]|nr:hypothetical protein [Paracoccaceae bacterium]
MIDLETYNRLAKSFGAPDFFISAIKITPVTTRSRAGRLGIVVSENLPILLLKQLGLRPNDIILKIQRIVIFWKVFRDTLSARVPFIPFCISAKLIVILIYG